MSSNSLKIARYWFRHGMFYNFMLETKYRYFHLILRSRRVEKGASRLSSFFLYCLRFSWIGCSGSKKNHERQVLHTVRLSAYWTNNQPYHIQRRYVFTENIPTDTRHCINVGLTSVHRLRRWTSVKPTLMHCLVSAGYLLPYCPLSQWSICVYFDEKKTVENVANKFFK